MNFRVPAAAAFLAGAAVLGAVIGREADSLRLPAGDWPAFAGEWAARGLAVRKVAADKKWIDILQYCGDQESVLDRGRKLYSLADQLTDLDPCFVYPYLFSSAMLVWQFDQAKPAVELLKKGMFYNQKEERLKLYLAAFAYSKDSRAGEIRILEQMVRGGAPPIARRILANLYVRRGEIDKARGLWRWIVRFSNEKGERRWAAGKLEEHSDRRPGE